MPITLLSHLVWSCLSFLGLRWGRARRRTATLKQVLDAEYAEATRLSPPPSPPPARAETLAAPSPAVKVGGTRSSLRLANASSPPRPRIRNRIAWLEVAIFLRTGVRLS